MKTRIVKIGNSQGIRLPKALLEASGLGEEVELVTRPEGLLIQPARSPREGWEEQLKAMHEAGDDKLLDDVVSLSSWDKEEWEW